MNIHHIHQGFLQTLDSFKSESKKRPFFDFFQLLLFSFLTFYLFGMPTKAELVAQVNELKRRVLLLDYENEFRRHRVSF